MKTEEGNLKMQSGHFNYELKISSLEKIRTLKGITYVSDADATDIRATAETLEELPRPVVWIVCCTQPDADYYELRRLVREKVTAIIFCGKYQRALLEEFQYDVELMVKAETIEEAVTIASYTCYRGETVVFSPGCSEYGDLFKGHDPHEAYVNAVKALKE